ncbi:MAG: hypothetical protein WCC06_02175 [Candidatus Aminicenantales bacterium]
MRRYGWLIGGMLIAAVSWTVGSTEKAVLTSDVTDPVSPIIKKYIQACGGSALAGIKTETRTGTMGRGVTGKIPLEIIAQAPDQWRFHLTFAWGDQLCCGFDGTTAWIQDTESVSQMSPRQRLDLQLLLDVQAPLKIQMFYPEMTIQGSEKIGNREVTTVMATSPDGIQTELVFDNATGLLRRAGEIRFEDYRDVGRIKRPFRILLGKDEGEEHLQMKIEFSKIQHDLEVDDSQFRWPACVLPVTQAPLFVHRKQVDVPIEALDACVGEYRHPELPNVIYTVTRQENHLMLERTGWGQKIEIKPVSEKDYFIQFLNWEFHFITDASGNVTHLEIRADQSLKVEKIR